MAPAHFTPQSINQPTNRWLVGYQALAQMPGGRLLAPLFFLMLLCLGLDSCFALVELVVATLIDTRLSPFAHPGKRGNWRLALLVVAGTFLPGLVFVCR